MYKSLRSVTIPVFSLVLIIILAMAVGKVASGVTRHDQLIDNECYEHITQPDGSNYVDILPTDMCMQIAWGE